MTINNNIDKLLARYFGGNTSEPDLQLLENWLSESSDNQYYFDQMTKLYEKTQLQTSEIPTPNTSEAKKAFSAYILKNETSKPVIELKPKSFFTSWILRAASIIVFVLVSATAYFVFNSNKEIVYATATDTKQVQLPDETVIKLSENSKISYNSNFSEKDKTVKLSGEATFKVGHKGSGKLKVIADETFIEDIGTVFTVKSLIQTDEVNVLVRQGQVHFYTLKDSGLVLNASETGVYNKKTKTFKILAQQSTSGIAGSKYFDFENISLSDAVVIIGNAYNVDINLSDKTIGKKRITVNFDGEDVNVMLQIITETLNLEVDKNSNTYQLNNRNQ